MQIAEIGKQFLLMLVGISAGGVIAAGVFAFLAIIGVFPRLMGKTCTRNHILLYETIIVAGGIWGNLSDLYELPVGFGGQSLGTFGAAGSCMAVLMLAIFGAAVGIFVGCLAMSLAETLQALPVISRRIRLAVGLQYLILAIALGKVLGSLTYFTRGMGIGL